MLRFLCSTSFPALSLPNSLLKDTRRKMCPHLSGVAFCFTASVSLDLSVAEESLVFHSDSLTVECDGHCLTIADRTLPPAQCVVRSQNEPICTNQDSGDCCILRHFQFLLELRYESRLLKDVQVQPFTRNSILLYNI